MQATAIHVSRLDLLSSCAALVVEVVAMTFWILRPEFLSTAVFGNAALSWSSVVGAVATLLPVPICWLCIGMDKHQ